MANRSDNFYSESALLKLEDGKEYRKKLYDETQKVLSNMLDVLPSVYNATNTSTNYSSHLKRVATEIARLKIEADNIQKDVSLETVRPEYLYQKFGYQVQVNKTFFPISDFGDETYRRFLKAVLHVIFNGSTLENIKYAVQLFTDHPVSVTDTISKRGVIIYTYLDEFLKNTIRLRGNLENLSNIEVSDVSGFNVYKSGLDYYISTVSLNQQVQIKRIQDGSIPSSGKVLLKYDYKDSIVDQFKLKLSFILSDVESPKKTEELIHQIYFLLSLIKPAHVYPEVSVYNNDDFKRTSDYFPSSTEEERFLGIDATVEQRCISNSYDDFRKFTRNESDTVVLEFNTEGHVFNKVSEDYGDIGYYIGEPDPLYRKKYKLYQLKGFSAQSSSLLNLPYTLEFNQDQRSLFNNFSYFDQTKSIKNVIYPQVVPNTDLPTRDANHLQDDLKVSALPIDFGVSVESGSFYSYQKGYLVNFAISHELLLPDEAKGNRVFIYINLDADPVIEYSISEFGILDINSEYLPLAQIDIPEDASVLWDHYIEDLRIYYFANLTLRGDTSGFSDFNVSQGIVLGLGTRPIAYKFDDTQSNKIYNFDYLNELNSLGMTLNGEFTLGITPSSYRADDLNYLFTGLEAETQESELGSIATPIKDGGFVLGLGLGAVDEGDIINLPTESFNVDLGTRTENAPQLEESSAAIGIDFVFDEAFGVSVPGMIFNDAVFITGTQTIYQWPTGVSLILNDFTSLLNPTLEEVIIEFTVFDIEQGSLLNDAYLGPFDQIALDGASIIDQTTGLPVLDINGFTVS